MQIAKQYPDLHVGPGYAFNNGNANACPYVQPDGSSQAFRLNRAAVFFRYFLALPARILASLLTWGACTLVGFAAWLVTLVAGRLPLALHGAFCALLRFQARKNGYWSMLTPAYPSGLYGDTPGMAAWADQGPAPAEGFGMPEGYGMPGYGVPGYGAPSGYGAPGYGVSGFSAPGYGAPGGYGVPGAYGVPAGYRVRPVFQPATWLLHLTAGARGLVTTFIVLGALFMAGELGLNALTFGLTVSEVSVGGTGPAINFPPTTGGTVGLGQLEHSHGKLAARLNTWQRATARCGKDLACMTKPAGQAAGALGSFVATLGAASVPSSAASDQFQVIVAAATARTDLTRLSKATTVAQYQSTLKSTGIARELTAFDRDYAVLFSDLESS